MTQLAQATCPGCRRPLTVPTAWTGQVVRCKHCRQTAMVQRPGAPIVEPLADGSLPEYTPPATDYVAAFDARDRYAKGRRYKGPRSGSKAKFAAFGLFVLALVGAAVGLVRYQSHLFQGGPVVEGDNTEVADGSTGGPSAPVPTTAGFPRRLMAVSIHSYMYANPLHNGDSGLPSDDARKTGTDAAVRRLAERLNVPRDQRYHLTDARLSNVKTASEPAAQKGIPLKPVIEGAVGQFLDASRAQDRIVFLFAGHAMEKGGEAYLVPLEGDLDEAETLVPLKWLYEKLAACKAQEKIAIFDVSRFHPGRGVERPHAGLMSESLEAALHAAPEGVTVVTSCSKGEHSLEDDDTTVQINNSKGERLGAANLRGSFFLNLIQNAPQELFNPNKKLPVPSEPFPIDNLLPWLEGSVNDAVKTKFDNRKQTVKTTWKRPTEAVAPDPGEAVPPPLQFPAPPPSADPKAVQAIVREVQLPAVKSLRADAPPPAISDVLPFSEQAMKEYLAGAIKTGDKPNELQKAIMEAVAEVRNLSESEKGTDLPETFPTENSDRDKARFRQLQEVPARVEAILADHIAQLEQVAPLKAKQTKRWQVHYDYVLAQLKLRLCYVNQYNLALANVRGDKLPELKAGDTGYRLTAEMTLHKNTPSEMKDKYAEAQKVLTEIAKAHPNTPWAVLAKSDRTVAIGLRLTSGTVTK